MQTERRATVQCEAVVRLTEGELRFLDALTGYGWEPFLKVFKEKIGAHYVEAFEDDGRAFFAAVREQIPPLLVAAEKARAVFEEKTK